MGLFDRFDRRSEQEIHDQINEKLGELVDIAAPGIESHSYARSMKMNLKTQDHTLSQKLEATEHIQALMEEAGLETSTKHDLSSSFVRILKGEKESLQDVEKKVENAVKQAHQQEHPEFPELTETKQQALKQQYAAASESLRAFMEEVGITDVRIRATPQHGLSPEPTYSLHTGNNHNDVLKVDEKLRDVGIVFPVDLEAMGVEEFEAKLGESRALGAQRRALNEQAEQTAQIAEEKIRDYLGEAIGNPDLEINVRAYCSPNSSRSDLRAMEQGVRSSVFVRYPEGQEHAEDAMKMAEAMDAAGLSSNFQLSEVDGLEGLESKLAKGKETMAASQGQAARMESVKQEAVEAAKGISVQGASAEKAPTPPSTPALPEAQRNAQHGRG